MESTSQLKIEAVELGPCSMKLRIEVPAEKADKTYRRIFQRTANQVRIPGFRAGHVPQKILLDNYGAQINGEVANTLIQEAYREAAGDYREQMANEPALSEETQNVTYEAGKPFIFELVFDVKPKVTLPEYKGLNLTKEVKTVTQEMMDVTVQGMLEQGVKYETVEGPTQADDLVTVSHTATPADGKEKPENKYHMLDTEKTWLALRKPEMYPGISESLLGMKVNDERDVTITFPADYREETLRERVLTYHFKVLEIRRGQKPALNDDFAKSQGFESLDKMNEIIKESLQRRLDAQVRGDLIKQIQDQLFANLDFALPPTVLENAERDMLNAKLESEQRKGTKEEDLKAKMEELRKEAKTDAEKNLREIYLLHALVAAEKISVTNEDMAQYQQMLRQQQGNRPIGKLIQEKQQSGEIQNYMMNRTFDHLFDLIIEKANVTEKKA